MIVKRDGEETVMMLPPDWGGEQLRRLFDRVLRVNCVQALGDRTGVRLRHLRAHVCGRRGDALVIPAAYEPLALQLLDAVGVPYVRTGRRPDPLPFRDGAAESGGDPLLAAVARNERIVVRVGESVDVGREVVRFCRSVDVGAEADEEDSHDPSPSILVLAKRHAEVRRIAHLLETNDQKVSSFTRADLSDRRHTRVAVATYLGAAHGAVGLWDRDVVITVDVADALGEHGRTALPFALRFDRFDRPSAPRVIGFARTDFRPSPNQYAEMLNVYGPAELILPAPGMVNREVEYLFLRVGGPNPHALPTASLPSTGGVKEAVVWTNPIRNRLLGRVARAFASGTSDVAAIFPELAGHPLVGKKSAVLVVAENPEHAGALLRHDLAGWYPVGPSLGPPPPSWGQPAGRLSPAVSTFDGLAEVNFAGYDVVVRADAGAGALPLAPGALVSGDVSGPLLLIDFDDRPVPVLARFAGRRREAYKSAGWRQVGEVHRHPELDRFLERHPNGDSARRAVAAVAKRFAANSPV
jgi:hypothetical protein